MLAEKALWRAVAGVIEEHRQSGRPLAIWRDEKVAWISAEEFHEGFAQGSIKRWGRIAKARKTVLPANWGMGEIAIRGVREQLARREQALKAPLRQGERIRSA
ncbi:MAG: hypothetical protein HY600_02720 [Candidatus Omnitrophica bacterium]|nr:hypothetical protein [Candidatus Omnitrophota bacterium]